jgi:hypothetical protein
MQIYTNISINLRTDKRCTNYGAKVLRPYAITCRNMEQNVLFILISKNCITFGSIFVVNIRRI